MFGFFSEYLLKRVSRHFTIPNGPPFIIIGMHRSGTSIVNKILREAGGYLGYQLDPNNEAIIFLRFNQNFLTYSGVSWDFIPDDYSSDMLLKNLKVALCLLSNKHLLWSEFFRFLEKENTEKYKLRWDEYHLPMINGREALNFKKYILKNNAVPFWGWKDPRTTITLPLWMKIFPNARIIHVVRNGIDASLSLWTRSHKSGEGAPFCLDPIYCFDLWEKYVKEGLQWRSLGKDRYIEIQYEDLIDDPVVTLKTLLSFTGVPISKALSLSTLVNRSRRNRPSSEEVRELVEYAKQSHTFRSLGYES